MPFSDRAGDGFFLQTANQIRPRTVLDVGPGAGKYADLAAQMNNPPRMYGLEIWEPYVHQFDLLRKYHTVWVGDVRQWTDFEFDLVLFGDVLEHMTRDESLAVWEMASHQARWGLISVPIIHYPQGAEFGNPHEVHVQEHLTIESVTETYGPFEHVKSFGMTATFFRRFGR
jgi:hypothetical protein